MSWLFQTASFSSLQGREGGEPMFKKTKQEKNNFRSLSPYEPWHCDLENASAIREEPGHSESSHTKYKVLVQSLHFL